MMSSVVHELKAIPVPKKGNPPTDEQLDDRLQHLAISTKVLHILINLVKVRKKSSFMVAEYLKKNYLFFFHSHLIDVQYSMLH